MAVKTGLPFEQCAVVIHFNFACGNALVALRYRAPLELLEEIGYADITIQAIAARAEVSNETTYRWWSNKAAVVMEAFAQQTANI